MSADLHPLNAVLVFACLRGVRGHTNAGHHLYEPGDGGCLARVLYPDGFTPEALDGGYCHADPNGRQPQGGAKLSRAHGWMLLAVWDRTGDARGNSHATFLVRGEHDFPAVCLRAEEAYPELWARIAAGGPVYLIGGT